MGILDNFFNHRVDMNARTNLIADIFFIVRHDVGSAGNIFIEAIDRNLQDKDIWILVLMFINID